MKDIYTIQTNEIKKLNYSFFEKIAASGDPLTYTFSESEGSNDVQVEISVKKHKKIEALILTIDFCSDNGKWMHKSDASASYLISKDDTWQDSSYDGSEFLE